MPYARLKLNAAQRDDLLTAEAWRRQCKRRELYDAACEQGRITLPEGRLLVMDSTFWWLFTPCEAR